MRNGSPPRLPLHTRSKKPDFLLEAREEQAQVWDALRRIKAEFREILVMKYIEGLNYDGIAQRLQIPRGTVMSRLYHARKAFAAQYAITQEMGQ